MRYVIDASVAVKWFVPEPLQETALWALDDVVERYAPDLLVLEVLNVMSLKVKMGEIELRQAAAAAKAVEGNMITLIADRHLTDQALALSVRLKHALYDCLYLALAIDRRIPLLTADRKFAVKCQTVGVEADVIDLSLWDGPRGQA